MAFTTVIKKDITDTPEELYKATDDGVSIVFGGFICNKSETTNAFFNVTYKYNGEEIALLKNTPIPIGSTAILPKKVMPKNSSLEVSTDADTSGMIDMSIEILTVE